MVNLMSKPKNLRKIGICGLHTMLFLLCRLNHGYILFHRVKIYLQPSHLAVLLVNTNLQTVSVLVCGCVWLCVVVYACVWLCVVVWLYFSSIIICKQ